MLYLVPFLRFLNRTALFDNDIKEYSNLEIYVRYHLKLVGNRSIM